MLANGAKRRLNAIELVPHQSDLDKPDLAAMGVALVYHNLSDGVLVPERPVSN
jgi:hypothetical protein